MNFFFFKKKKKAKMRLKQRKKLVLRWEGSSYVSEMVRKISIGKFFGSRFAWFGPTNRDLK